MERLLRHLSLEPPPAFQVVTLAQVMRADREVFSFLAHNVTDIRPDANDVRPLDLALENALKGYNAAFHLLPLPKASTSEHAPKKSYSEPYPTHGGPKGRGKSKHGKGGKSFGSREVPRATAAVWAGAAKIVPFVLTSTLVNAARLQLAVLALKDDMFVSKVGASKRMPTKMVTLMKLLQIKND